MVKVGTSTTDKVMEIESTKIYLNSTNIFITQGLAPPLKTSAACAKLRVWINFVINCREHICHWFILQWPYVGCWRKKNLLQKYFSKYNTTYFLYFLKKISCLKLASFLEKFKCSFFLYFQFRSHDCDYENTKALIGHYRSADL